MTENIDCSKIDLNWLEGRIFSGITFSEPETWFFGFNDDSGISTETLWRIVKGGKIALTSEDHEQSYGHKIQIDAVIEANQLLETLQIRACKIHPGTSDLIITLDNSLQLEILTTSRGYENWHMYTPSGAEYGAQGAGQFYLLEP